MNQIFMDLKKYHIDIRDFLPDLGFPPLNSSYILDHNDCSHNITHNSMNNNTNQIIKRCLSTDNKNVQYIGQVRNNNRNGYGTEFYTNTTLNKRANTNCNFNNAIKVKAFFFEDKIDGEPVHIYNESGDLVFVGIYDQNKPVRGVIYTSDGWPLFVGGLNEFKPHGHCLFFDENKCLECQGSFCNGEINDDNFKIYYKSGYIKFEGYAKLDGVRGKGKLFHDGLFGTRMCFEDMELVHMVNDAKNIQKFRKEQKNTLIAEFSLTNYRAFGEEVVFMSMRRKGINQAPFKSMVVDIDDGMFSGTIKVNDQNEKLIFLGNIYNDEE